MTTAREDTTRLAHLLGREHHAMADFLIALAAFDRDRRWAELGYRSLFSFLTRELRLSAGAAQYRKTAAELVQRLPEVEAALRRGDLCLSAVVEVSKVLTPENAADVLPRFFGKSSRDAAFVAASIRPAAIPPRRDFVVTPVRSERAPAARADETPGAFRAPEVVAPSAPPASGPASLRLTAIDDRPKVRPLDAERARMNITVSRRLLDKLSSARDALSHSHPGASEETILELGLDLILRRHARRRGIGARPRKPPRAPPGPTVQAADPAAAPSPPPKRSRHVPAGVWRAVWERDGGRCVWPLENGGVCGSTYQLELDHLRGFALGAGTTADECRLLCEWHNDLHARELYGNDLMNDYTRPKGPRSSEPVAVWAYSVIRYCCSFA